jgi:hypothetical protein
MQRLRTLLGRPELHATGSIAFLVLITWPLWTSARASTTFLSMFAVWIAFTAFTIASMAVGREPEEPVLADLDDEGGSP